jgi:hypothetical protein
MEYLGDMPKVEEDQPYKIARWTFQPDWPGNVRELQM